MKKLFGVIFLLLAMPTFSYGTTVYFQTPFHPVMSKFRTIDGDTFAYKRTDHLEGHFRLLGYDTPEIFTPKCKAEKELGVKGQGTF